MRCSKLLIGVYICKSEVIDGVIMCLKTSGNIKFKVDYSNSALPSACCIKQGKLDKRSLEFFKSKLASFVLFLLR